MKKKTKKQLTWIFSILGVLLLFGALYYSGIAQQTWFRATAKCPTWAEQPYCSKLTTGKYFICKNGKTTSTTCRTGYSCETGYGCTLRVGGNRLNQELGRN